MDVIILAAGKGERLLPLTINTPKSLIDLGNGMTILESQLHSINQCGIKRVHIVAGYLVEQIDAKVKRYREAFDMTIEIIYNPFFDTSNNLISLWFAKHVMVNDFVIVNGDDVFKPEVLSGLLNANLDEGICMVVDQKAGYDSDDMKVVISDGYVKRIGKDIPPEEANGESIGMIRVRGHAKKFLVQTLERMVRDNRNRDVFYLKAFQQLINDGRPVVCHEIDPSEWAEVDFHPDLKVIKEHIHALKMTW